MTAVRHLTVWTPVVLCVKTENLILFLFSFPFLLQAVMETSMGQCLCVKLVLSSAHICSTACLPALPPTYPPSLVPPCVHNPHLSRSFFLLQLLHVPPHAWMDPLAVSIGPLSQSGWQNTPQTFKQRGLSPLYAWSPSLKHPVSFCWTLSTIHTPPFMLRCNSFSAASMFSSIMTVQHILLSFLSFALGGHFHGSSLQNC